MCRVLRNGSLVRRVDLYDDADASLAQVWGAQIATKSGCSCTWNLDMDVFRTRVRRS
jgi:hypothetical protein